MINITNEDKMNNNIDNLKIMTASEHSKNHKNFTK